jgi:uncharacterized protein (DUF58 family)
VLVLCAGFGLATGRADVVLLGAPFALGFLLTLLAIRPLLGSRVPTATVTVDEASFGSNTAVVRTEIDGADGVEYVAVAQPALDAGPIGGMAVLAGGPAAVSADARFRTRLWGPTDVARPDLLGVGPDGAYLAGPVRRGRATSELVLPAVEAIAPLVLPPISGGWAGAHVSRRPGQGSDLVDLREFAPGDRLRSIHWRAYARHEKLYTRRTLSDADAEIMICLDLSAILVPRPAKVPTGRLQQAVARLFGYLRRGRERRAIRRGDAQALRRTENERRLRASSLDLSVAAAAAIASAHLGQGDRVGLVTATLPRRLTRPGTGNRQLLRIRHQLALLEVRRSRLADVSWWGLRPGQVVVLCSPMTDGRQLAAALDCQARGHRVVVVDVLPLSGMLRAATARDADHLRILTVERELRLDRLRGSGIPVLSWDAGDISLQMATALQVMRSRR